MARHRINLLEKVESVKTELEIAEVPNKFFFNTINNLEISKYSKYEVFIGDIEDQILRAILKCKNQPSIIAIQNNFRELEKEKIQTKIHKFNTNKASQHYDILKVGLSICFICFYESPLKMVKNAFYFILKALFVLKIFKFLS